MVWESVYMHLTSMVWESVYMHLTSMVWESVYMHLTSMVWESVYMHLLELVAQPIDGFAGSTVDDSCTWSSIAAAAAAAGLTPASILSQQLYSCYKVDERCIIKLRRLATLLQLLLR
jgi:hypothetical protein